MKKKRTIDRRKKAAQYAYKTQSVILKGRASGRAIHATIEGPMTPELQESILFMCDMAFKRDQYNENQL